MTKAEAIKLVSDATHNPEALYRNEHEICYSEPLVKALMALGLLKLDDVVEEEKP